MRKCRNIDAFRMLAATSETPSFAKASEGESVLRSAPARSRMVGDDGIEPPTCPV